MATRTRIIRTGILLLGFLAFAGCATTQNDPYLSSIKGGAYRSPDGTEGVSAEIDFSLPVHNNGYAK